MGGAPSVTYPTPPPQPTTGEAIQEWVTAMPQIFAEQQRQAPLQAQQQVELAQQYAQPLGQAMQQAQAAMYPETAALQEQMAGQAATGMQAGMPDWMREQYRDVYAAQLGTNIGSGIGADYMSTGMLQAQQGYQDYYRNLGLSLAGRQPLASPQMPQTGQYAQQFQPQSVMNMMTGTYGTYAAAGRPIVTQQESMIPGMMGGAGSIFSGLGALGFMGSSKRFKKNIKLW